MKRLPCKTKGCAGRGHAALPGGRPYLMGRPASHYPFRYRCATCGFPTIISLVEFNGLPDLKLAELEELGELKPLLRDLRGAGYADRKVQDQQTGRVTELRPAEDLFAAGFTPTSLDEMDRAREGDRQLEEAVSGGLHEELVAQNPAPPASAPLTKRTRKRSV